MWHGGDCAVCGWQDVGNARDGDLFVVSNINSYFVWLFFWDSIPTCFF